MNTRAERIEGRLGRSTLSGIGRQLGAIYENMVAEDLPESWRVTLDRLAVHYKRIHDADGPHDRE